MKKSPKISKLRYKVSIHHIQAMKLEYFDLVMMNCPTTPPPPPPAEGNPDEPKDDVGDDDKPEPKRQSIKNGWKILMECR